MELGAVLVGGAALVLGVSLVTSRAAATGRSDQAREDAGAILEAARLWRSQNDSDPGCPTVTQLRHEGALDDIARPDDPWGSRYRVQCDGNSTSVRSAGPDGELGTLDDVQVGTRG